MQIGPVEIKKEKKQNKKNKENHSIVRVCDK